jgi:hypothetical protein
MDKDNAERDSVVDEEGNHVNSLYNWPIATFSRTVDFCQAMARDLVITATRHGGSEAWICIIKQVREESFQT